MGKILPIKTSEYPVFSILCKRKFHLSRFTHLILRLCYLDLGLRCRSHPFSFHSYKRCAQSMLFITFGLAGHLGLEFDSVMITSFSTQYPSKFAHPIPSLWHLIFRIRGNSHLFCFEYLMWRRTHIIVWAFDLYLYQSISCGLFVFIIVAGASCGSI